MKQTSLLTLAAALVLTLTAHADTLTFTFDQPDQSASTPGILTYSGTITAATGNKAPVYLNGDAFNIDPPFLLDDAAFGNAPEAFASGQSYTGVLFNVPLTDPLADGTFNGTFSFLGGADPSSQDILDTESFSFSVAPATSTSVTPEPPSVLLLLSGATLLAAFPRRQMAPPTDRALPLAR